MAKFGLFPVVCGTRNLNKLVRPGNPNWARAQMEMEHMHGVAFIDNITAIRWTESTEQEQQVIRATLPVANCFRDALMLLSSKAVQVFGDMPNTHKPDGDGSESNFIIHSKKWTGNSLMHRIYLAYGGHTAKISIGRETKSHLIWHALCWFTLPCAARRTLVIQATTLARESSTCCRAGSAGIAPLSVTVRAPQTFANFRASRNRPSSCLSHKNDNMSCCKLNLCAEQEIAGYSEEQGCPNKNE